MTVLGVTFLAGLVLFLLWPASLAFLVIFAAILFAVFVNALASLVPRRLALPQKVVRVGVILLLFSLLAAFFMVAGPRFSEQASQLSAQLPRAMERLQKAVSEQPWSRWLQNLRFDRLQPDVPRILAGATGVFSTAFEAVANILVVIFIGIYFSLQPEIYLQGFLHLIPKQNRDRAKQLLFALDHALSWWILGRFTSMAAVGILTAIGLELIGMPLALVLGVIAGLFYFVPYVGPVVAAVPGILIGLLQSPLMAANVLVVYSLVLLVEGNILTPMIQRRAVSLPPAILLSAQFLMGIFYGLLGVLLATPMAVVMIVAVQVLYVHHVLQDPVRLLGQHGPSEGK